MYLLETGKTVLLGVLRGYYKESRICSLIRLLDSKAGFIYSQASGGISDTFRRSYLGSLTRISREGDIEALGNSRVLTYCLDYLREKNSILSGWLSGLRFPLRTASAILITATVINAALSFLLKAEIGLSGWLIRGVFLLLGIGGIFCSTDWAALRNNSRILKFIKKE